MSSWSKTSIVADRRTGFGDRGRQEWIEDDVAVLPCYFPFRSEMEVVLKGTPLDEFAFKIFIGAAHQRGFGDCGRQEWIEDDMALPPCYFTIELEKFESVVISNNHLLSRVRGDGTPKSNESLDG